MDATQWSSFVRQASAEELLAMARAARAARRAAPARGALLEIRERFPDEAVAERATFLLGRVEGELAADSEAATRWFARYVREFPGGRFVEQARGRILSDLVRRGESVDVQRAARDYLEHHPKGSYASLARRLSSPAP